MMEKETAMVEFKKFNEIRDDFFDMFDKNIPKKDNNIEFDFTTSVTLNAKEVYELFFKLDYQARKIRGFLANEIGIS